MPTYGYITNKNEVIADKNVADAVQSDVLLILLNLYAHVERTFKKGSMMMLILEHLL